jgi:ATP/maltotriose-dependent transcriptional regulator MalT
MIKEFKTLSKLSRPRLFRILPRDRLFRLLDEKRCEHPVVWIAGPPGAGKTALVANYLEVQKLPGIWYQVDGGDSDPAFLFYYLAMAARKAVGKKPLVLPLLTSEYLPDLPGFTRRFFRKLFSSLPSSATLVLDNYQEAAPESVFHTIIQGAIAELCNYISLIVISRLSPSPQYAREIANNLIAQIGWEELCLNLEETERTADVFGGTAVAEPPVDLQVLHAKIGS